jgi:hypothetical protein
MRRGRWAPDASVFAGGTAVFELFGWAVLLGVSVVLLFSGINTRLTVFFGSGVVGLAVVVPAGAGAAASP